LSSAGLRGLLRCGGTLAALVAAGLSPDLP